MSSALLETPSGYFSPYHTHRCCPFLGLEADIVIKVHVVVLVFEITGKGLDYMCTKTFLMLFFPPSIHVKAAEVPVGTISQYPHFDPMLYRLHRHVLLQGQAALKLDHGFIDGNILGGLVQCCKLRPQVVDEWLYLT